MPDGHALDTKLLMRLLRDNANFDEFLARGGDAVNNPTLPECLLRHLSESDKTVAQVAEASMLSQSFSYQVFSGIRKPGRNALISIALALGLGVESTQRLLVVAQKGELYPRVRRDAAILFAIEHGYSLSQTEELLQSSGEASLLSRTYRDSF
jgi:rRNA-processing protein FCF1